MSALIVLAKPVRRSKTIWANAIAAAAAGLALLAQELPNFRERIPAAWYLSTITLLGMVNIWLRFRTTAPLRRGKVQDDGKELGDPHGKKV
jgi:hypothetical protein